MERRDNRDAEYRTKKHRDDGSDFQQDGYTKTFAGILHKSRVSSCGLTSPRRGFP